MKVLYLLAIAICLWSSPAKCQFFYSTFQPTVQYQPIFAPQPFAALAQQQQRQQPQTGATVTYNLPPVQANGAEFRGFGYRTDYQNGATSTVYYVTGPESSILRNFPKSLPNINVQTQPTNENRARSLASNLIDANAFPNVAQHLRSILQPSEFQQLFDTANNGAFNFYTYPADTVPLTRSGLDNKVSTETTTTTAATETATETTTESSTAKIDGVVAESVLASRILPASEEAEETTSTTETVSSSSSSSSSEASTSSDTIEVAASTSTTTSTEAPSTSFTSDEAPSTSSTTTTTTEAPSTSAALTEPTTTA